MEITDGAAKSSSLAVVKVVVLGSSNVGKTALMRKFCLDKFSDARRATVGADYMTKKIRILNHDVVLQIWDTAGQERFHQGTIGGAFYRGSNGALLVYDVCNEKSFEQLSNWRDEALSRLENDFYFPIVVVGNKIDLRNDDNIIDQSEVRNWCTDNGYGHIETSAKDGTGVYVAMEAIAALALEAQTHNSQKCGTDAKKLPNNSPIRIEELYSPSNNGFCGGNC